MSQKLFTGIPGGVCGVYAITSPSGKRYIGSSVDIRRRWYEHHWRMKNAQSSSPQLDRAYAKYGLSLKFEVLEECDEKSLREREQYYLDTFRPEFNVSMDAYCAAKWACALGANQSSGSEKRKRPVQDSRGFVHESISAAAHFAECGESAMRRALKHHDRLPSGLRFRFLGEEWKPERPPINQRRRDGIRKSLEIRRAEGRMGHSDKAKQEKSERLKGVPWTPARRAAQDAKRRAAK